MNSPKSRVAVISTKNPTKEILPKTIEALKQYYPEFDIVIVDSDSEDTSTFELVPEDCIIEYCQNRAWELGAWYYAFHKYPQYEVYMFLQDSLMPNSRIPDVSPTQYENGTIYTYNYWARVADGGYFDHLQYVYQDTEFQFISDMHPYEGITGGAHTFFMLNREDVPNIINLEIPYRTKHIVKSKIDAWLSERTVGIMADKQPRRIDASSYFTKINCHRDY